MRKLLLSPLLCLGLVVAGVAADNIVEEIVARINNDIITRSDYERSREQLRSELCQQDQSGCQQKFAEREKSVLRDLIDQQLLVQKGKDLGITGDTELVKRLDEVRKQMNLDSMEELEKAAQQQGVSYEEFKENMRNGIITQHVISREVGSHINIGPEEEQKYYHAHKQEFERPERVRLSEILLEIRKPSGEKVAEGEADDPAQVAAADKHAQELLAQIRSGAKFEDVAKKGSDDPSAAQGGELGYFNRGMLAKELEQKTFAMKAGDVSDVIRAKQGFIILKVSEHQAAGLPPLKEVEPQIQEAIYLDKLQPALRAYLTKLREDAYVDVHEGYVDSGASPHQTKPVVTVSTATGKSKKKKKKMLIF